MADMNSGSLMSMPVSSALKQKNTVILDQFQTAADAIASMKQNSTRAVLISDKKKEIVGLISKTDIIYKVSYQHKSPAKVSIMDIMSSPIISVAPAVSIADALSIMEKHDIRQIVVSSGPSVYGIIDREDIIIKIDKAVAETADAFKIDSPLCIMNPLASASLADKRSMLVCPHCSTEYSDKESLSKHIKSTHPS
jgi:CBS domain-containing protein